MKRMIEVQANKFFGEMKCVNRTTMDLTLAWILMISDQVIQTENVKTTTTNGSVQYVVK